MITRPTATRPRRRSWKSAVTNWRISGSGLTSITSSRPSRRWDGIESNCPNTMSANEKPMFASANTRAAWAKVMPPNTGTLVKIT